MKQQRKNRRRRRRRRRRKIQRKTENIKKEKKNKKKQRRKEKKTTRFRSGPKSATKALGQSRSGPKSVWAKVGLDLSRSGLSRPFSIVPLRCFEMKLFVVKIIIGENVGDGILFGMKLFLNETVFG